MDIRQMFGDLGEVVDAYYMEPHRYYHTTRHISRMFLEANNLGIELNNAEKLAILFHDIVYLPGCPDNEDLSADLMYTLYCSYPDLFYNFSNEDLHYARYIIWDTKNHKANTEDSGIVLDLDLVGLADSPCEYDNTTGLVRAEFSSTPDNKWLVGRENFLRSFLERDRIFHTDLFYTRYEENARKNMTRELENL